MYESEALFAANNQALWKVSTENLLATMCTETIFKTHHQNQMLVYKTSNPGEFGAVSVARVYTRTKLTVGSYYFGPVGQFPTESPNPSTSAKLHQKTEELKVKIMCQDITKVYKYQITKTFL